MKVVTIMPNNWLAERMDELIRAVDEIFIGKIPSEDDLYGIHQVLVERRDAALIDAELAEPDADVAEVIEWLENERESILHYASLQVLPSGQLKAEESYRLAIAALRQYQFPLAIQWTGKNLREVIDLVDLNPSANKWTWEEYAQVVAEKGLKIFTPDGPVMAEIGDWIIQNGKDCYVTRQYQKPTGETSDGYHTFNELYHHRAILFAALSKAYPDKAWKSRKHHDGTMFGDDWFICGIETPKGQYTYHYNTTYWPLFAGKILDNAPEWDGHKPEDVERLMSLRQMGSTEPCEWCVDKHSYSIRYGLGGDTHKHCANCDRKLVK